MDHIAQVLADERENHALVRLEIAHGGGLILVHEPAVAGDIGGENGGEPAVDRCSLMSSRV